MFRLLRRNVPAQAELRLLACRCRRGTFRRRRNRNLPLLVT